MDLPLFAGPNALVDSLGIHLEHRTKRDNKFYSFSFSTTLAPLEDGTTPTYPGQLSREAHMGFLSMMVEHRRPFPQIIQYRMSDLCERLERFRGGRTYDELREAIISTSCLTIWSKEALFDHKEKRAYQEGKYQVYDSVGWQGTKLPDGQTADLNFVKISDWIYASVTNLGVMSDYDYWRRLNRRSDVGSRLWEFLHPRFYSGNDDFSIDYSDLADRMPLRRHPSPSLAKRQLQHPLEVLTEFKAIKKFERVDKFRLVLWRGEKMPVASQPKEVPAPPRGAEQPRALLISPPSDPAEAQNSSRQIVEQLIPRVALRLPEQELIDLFYKGRKAIQHPSDEYNAKKIIDQYTFEKAMELLPLAIEQHRVQYRTPAGCLGGIIPFIEGVAKQQEQRKLREQEKLRDTMENRKQAEVAQTDRQNNGRLLDIWKQWEDEEARRHEEPGWEPWKEELLLKIAISTVPENRRSLKNNARIEAMNNMGCLEFVPKTNTPGEIYPKPGIIPEEPDLTVRFGLHEKFDTPSSKACFRVTSEFVHLYTHWED